VKRDSQKRRALPAPPRHEGGEHENIFIAKIRDSESTRRAINYVARLASNISAHRLRRTRIKETLAIQAFPALLTNADADAARVFCIVMRRHRRVVDIARRARSRRGVNTSLSGTLFF
jgi:hypothetical protein